MSKYIVNSLVQKLNVAIDVDGLNGKIKSTGGQVIDVIANIVAVVGVIGLIVSIIAIITNGDNNEGGIKKWLIGIALSAMALMLVVGYKLFIKV